MALPSNIYRDYSGSAIPSGLASAMGASDMSFTLINAATWTNLNTHDLGTGSTGVPGGLGSGPFVVAVDYGTPNEEKILCSRANTSNNVVTVWSYGSVNGRGYDGTASVTHSVNAVCVPVLSATEADESNSAVYNTVGQIASTGQLLVGSGANSLVALTPGSSGTVLTSTGATSIPAWQQNGIIGNPTARMYSSSTQTVGTTNSQITGFAKDFKTGTIDVCNDTSSGATNAITIKVAGTYQVNGQVYWGTAANVNGYAIGWIYKNGSAVAKNLGSSAVGSGAVSPNPSTLLNLAVGDVLTLWASTNNGTAQAVSGGTTNMWLSCSLVGQ